MSLKNATTLFSRQFKKAFDQGKYQNLTGVAGHNSTHLGWVSNQDFKMGRFMFSAAVVVYCFTLYLEPSWFHETIGHLKPYATYDFIATNLSGQEKELNEQILHRAHEEAKLDHFLHSIKESEN